MLHFISRLYKTDSGIFFFFAHALWERMVRVAEDGGLSPDHPFPRPRNGNGTR